MANIAILGVYSTKSALDTAQKATASAGDTYIVGSKIPYDLYTFASGEFKKGDKVSNVVGDLSTDVTIDDITVNPVVDKLYGISFVGGDGKTLKVRKGLHLGEIPFYVPES